MKFLILWSMLGIVLIMTVLGAAQPVNSPTIIGLTINADIPSSATEEQAHVAEQNLSHIYDQINQRNLAATVFSPGDTAHSYVNLGLTRIGLSTNFELGISGNHSNEKLSTVPYAEQSTILKNSKRYVENAKVCGKNVITVHGFMPQSFDQNKDTYNVLDSLGIQYDAGFQAGVLYAPGHKNDVWPYLVEGHKFYAVPFSTYNTSGKSVVLDDSYFKDNGMSGSQWYDSLAGKFDEIQGKDVPLVIGLTSSISGSGDYMDALKKFMDYAVSKKASFVTIGQLVNMTKAGVRDVSALPASVPAGCPTCDQSSSNTNAKITVSMNNTTEVAAPTAVKASK